MGKHYVPTVEEFHVGFEFEYRPRERNGILAEINGNHTHIKKYEKMKFRVPKEAKTIEEKIMIGFYGEPTDLGKVTSFLEHDAIRVKYLDGSDLDELGMDRSKFWVPRKDRNTPYRLYAMIFPTTSPVPYTFIYNTKSKWMLINQGGDTRFAGNIKNKSELEKILNLLNIKI